MEFVEFMSYFPVLTKRKRQSLPHTPHSFFDLLAGATAAVSNMGELGEFSELKRVQQIQRKSGFGLFGPQATALDAARRDPRNNTCQRTRWHDATCGGDKVYELSSIWSLIA